MSPIKHPVIGLKNGEIEVLADYSVSPPEKFWDTFPKSELPVMAKSRVLVRDLNNMLLARKERLTTSSFLRGLKTVENLTNGAGSYQKTKLPPCLVKNAKNCYVYGAATTDTIVTWVKNDFASGPFSSPPLPGFRVNCLMAIPQGQKIRPVLNASLPENLSLNSNVNLQKLEKVVMCSARCFSYSVVDAGNFAWMTKLDMRDAYKNVPAKQTDLRLQGFSWLGKFFVENRQIFGARTAVANFDVMGSSVLDIVLADCEVDRQLVHRQLDDVPMVVPYNKKNWCLEFTEHYRKICKDLNILLAEDCKDNDKAFSCVQKGKVLGIWFNTSDLTWSYPEEKTEKVLRVIDAAISSSEVSLLEMQKLMGSLNDITLMCPFLKIFSTCLNETLGWLQSNIGKTSSLTVQAKKDLMIWVGFLSDGDVWKPICPRPVFPPISHITMTSDAAGFTSQCNVNVGVGNIGMDENGIIVFASQIFWPNEMKSAVDNKGKSFGSKTTTLEMVGLLIPFLCCPELLAGKHVVFQVDNIGCYFGWKNKVVIGDKTASILVRAMVVISSYLSCYVHVSHLPRMSSWEARLCDDLSRESSTSPNEKKLVNEFGFTSPNVLYDWLKNPKEDWEMANVFLDYVENKYIKK